MNNSNNLYSMKLNIGIIVYPGSNCAEDMKRYFPESFFIWHTDTKWRPMDLLILPGGFAFGDRDYKYATHEFVMNPGKKALESPVSKIIHKANKMGIPIFGVCNGFQILTQMGLLPGTLNLNLNQRFTCKHVNCTLNTTSKNVSLEVANSFGRYVYNSENYPLPSNQIFVTYNDKQYESENGSMDNIAGICDKDGLVYGMMPHPERTLCKEIKEMLITIAKYKREKRLKKQREKFAFEVKNLMNSEHISYKSTRRFLKNLHTSGEHVIQGPGENAGIVDIGGGYGIAIRIESHNHPTFIDPYNGAATGVGGIIRDIFTMGARPIALLDFLRFGEESDKNSTRLLHEAVRGIAEYGNCIGIANVGGACYREAIYNKNPLVNVACLGLVKTDKIVYGNAKESGDLLVYVGSRTGNDGINGAAMASAEFTSDSDMEALKSNIQKGDAFLEKLLMEACLEIVEADLLQGMQDMGAGGLLCSSVEVVLRGRNKTGKNLGCVMNVDKVPQKEGADIDECDKLISESQERMLLVVKSENIEKVFNIFKKWELEYEIVGEVNTSGKYEVVNNNNDTLFSENMTDFDDPTEMWELNMGKDPLQHMRRRICLDSADDNNILWNNYDRSIGCRTLFTGRGKMNYSVLNIHEVNKKLVISWGETFDECLQRQNENHASPLGLVNCLNYGHPKDSLGNMALFLENLTKKCVEYGVPVLGGNVSLYNATDDQSIYPTPVLVMIGIV